MAINILLVEDSQTDAEILSAAFEDINCSRALKVVTNGKEAIRFLQNLNQNTQLDAPFIILLDLNLPGKDGYEVLKEIKSNLSWCTIPTIIFSSSNAHNDILKSYQLHANAYITKPSDFEQYKEIAQSINSFWLKTVKFPDTKHSPTQKR